MPEPPQQAEARWLSDEEQRVWRQWVRVQTHLPVALTRQLQRDSAVSQQDYDVLVHLSESVEGQLRLSDLAQALEWDRSRLSHHITRMAGRGLVRKQQCPHDGRGALAVLTPLGAGVIEDAAPYHVRGVRAAIFDHLDADDLAALDRITASILSQLPRL